MIKNIFLTLVLAMFFSQSVMAADMKEIRYQNIKEGGRIGRTEQGWTVVGKKADNYYTKKISAGTSNFSEFYNKNGEFIFSTGTNYEFILDGKLYGYSNSELKFYQFYVDNDEKGDYIYSEEISQKEIEELFKDFKIINISEFSNSTNSLKLKKDKKHFKILLLNDTDRYFYHYGFTSNNAKFNTYPLRGFLDITKKGMIQFSRFGDNTKENPWFILLVR